MPPENTLWASPEWQALFSMLGPLGTRTGQDLLVRCFPSPHAMRTRSASDLSAQEPSVPKALTVLGNSLTSLRFQVLCRSFLWLP